jgi:hypothetical protein
MLNHDHAVQRRCRWLQTRLRCRCHGRRVTGLRCWSTRWLPTWLGSRGS